MTAESLEHHAAQRASRGHGTGTVGAIGELAVAADLMRHGYFVYRALSPTSPCDLIAYRKGMPFRVEVRTARVVRLVKQQADMLSFPLKAIDEGTFDVLALWVEGDGVYYLPVLPETPRCPYLINWQHLDCLRSWGVLRGARRWQDAQASIQSEPQVEL